MTAPSPHGPGPTSENRGPVLEIHNLTKAFAGTVALDGADLVVSAGEVHALVGHNGSGKSTLVKILAGYHHADPGSEAWLDGEPIDLTRSESLRDERLRFVHQELGLVLELNTIENLALRGGFAKSRYGRLLWSQQKQRAETLLARFGAVLDVRRPLSEATPVERTVIAIAGALQGWSGGSGVLVLDEPSAILPPGEVQELFRIVDEVRRTGMGVIYVSHRLDEIIEVADLVTVLRDGRVVACRNVDELDKRSLADLMVGAELAGRDDPVVAVPPDAPAVLEGRDLNGRYLSDASFTLRRGEILGVVGPAAAGHEELAYVVAGGSVYPVGGELRTPATAPDWIDVADAASVGAALVPGERATEGVVAEMGVSENLTLCVLDRLGRPAHLDRGREAEFADTWIERLDVRGAGPDAPMMTLSGGNQQKVLIGRSLCREPEILLLCEPTAGVDVGTRHAIHALIAEQARAGVAVLVSSSDVDDLLSMCTRVLVFHDGSVVRELAHAEITERSLVHAMQNVEEES